MRLRRPIAVLAAAVVVSGCAGEAVWAPDDAVEQALYRPDGPPKLTLITVQSTKNGSGAHSGLMVSGAHRAMFDPAGTFYHPAAPERNDVHFGITENVWKVYVDYHARETYDVVVQEVEVSADVAQAAMRAIQAYGPVPKAQCSLAVSRILTELPGFGSIPVSWSPNKTSAAFAALPGASFERITDDDADANHGVLFAAKADHEASVKER